MGSVRPDNYRVSDGNIENNPKGILSISIRFALDLTENL